MRALVLSVVMLMSAAAAAQNQGLSRPPPPGQPTGPSQPVTAVPGYNGGNNGGNYGYDDWDVPEGFRRQGVLAVIERDALMDRLARVEEQLGRAMDRADRSNSRDSRDIRDALRQVREEMKGLRSDINKAPDLKFFRRRSSPPQAPPQAPMPPQVQPISEGQLQNLLNAIAKESFGDGKVRVVEAAAPTQFFLVSQVQRILTKFSFGDDKLDAMRALWPRVLDRENSYNLYSSFNFQGEKDQLKQIIGR